MHDAACAHARTHARTHPHMHTHSAVCSLQTATRHHRTCWFLPCWRPFVLRAKGNIKLLSSKRSAVSWNGLPQLVDLHASLCAPCAATSWATRPPVAAQPTWPPWPSFPPTSRQSQSTISPFSNQHSCSRLFVDAAGPTLGAAYAPPALDPNSPTDGPFTFTTTAPLPPSSHSWAQAHGELAVAAVGLSSSWQTAFLHSFLTNPPPFSATPLQRQP